MRAALLISALGLVFLLVRAGPWLAETFAVYENRSALEDSLDAFIQRELADKAIPGLSISLIHDQRVILERGYGWAHRVNREPATAYTVYRAGALSQAFTTTALLERAERGLLRLDAPIDTYLPDFRPLNPYGHPITLRQLLSHQSGLPREAPVGHYFDASGPGLAATVASLNTVTVVYPPETFTKYSNAGFAVAGYLIEAVQQRPFEQHLRAILDRMELRRTSFTPRFDLRARLAHGYQWTFDGRATGAPLVDPGASPALGVFTTANDLGRFLKILFADGIGPHGAILSPASIEDMWTPQPATARQEVPYGLGFVVSTNRGERRVYIEDSFHGFSARIDVLPDQKVGVALLSTMANANAVLERIATYAMALVQAEQAGLPLPPPPHTTSIAAPLRNRLVGSYAGPSGEISLSILDGELYLCQDVRRTRLCAVAGSDTLVTDDRHNAGTRVVALPQGSLQIGQEIFSRRNPGPPLLQDADLLAYVGVYRNDAHRLFILEKEGRLFTLLDWIRYLPLTRETGDIFLFPAEGPYGGEIARFARDESGLVRGVTLAHMTFEREAGPLYPLPMSQLARAHALDRILVEVDTLSAAPANALRPELVDIAVLDPLLNLDIRYASENNPAGRPIYEEPRAFLQRPVAEALFRVQESVRRAGYGLIVYDAYQPWKLTQALRLAAPDSLERYFIGPEGAGPQNRACAVALNLYDLNTGLPLAMPTEVHAFIPEASTGFPITDDRLRWNRDYLRRVMEAEGFAVDPYQWWQFEHTTCEDYPVLNISFETLRELLFEPTAPDADSLSAVPGSPP